MMGIDITIRHYDRQLLIYVVLLAIIGTVMLYSASWYESFARSNGRTDMLFLQGHLTSLREAEVMDIDEDAYRQGILSARPVSYTHLTLPTILLV